MINSNNYNCLSCNEPARSINTCGNYLRNINIEPIFECPRRNCVMEEETCSYFYPLDDPKFGLHSKFTIPIKDDMESGIMLDRSIPFGLIDFRDLGRNGECSDDCNKRGKILNYYKEDGETLMYQIESKGWHNYIWKYDCEDDTKELICKQDRRIPVEALLPYDVCEFNSYNCQSSDCENQPPISVCDLENPCPFKTISLVCDNGKCNAGWLENPIGVVDTDSVDMTIRPKQGGGVELLADVRICPNSANILDIKTCGLDLILCPDSGLEKRDCGLAIKICRTNENGSNDNNDQVLTLSSCGLSFNIKDTDTINLSKTANGLTADLRFADTNTINHDVNSNGLISNVKYQNRPSTNISENSSGLYVDVNLADRSGLEIKSSGLSIDLASCSGNLASLETDGLCVKLYKDDRFFTGNGTLSSPLSFLPPSIAVGGTANNLNLQTVSAPNFASAVITLGSVNPPFTAPSGYKWVITLNSTLTIACEEDPLDLDQETVAGHLILVNGNANHIGGAYHAVGNLVASPSYPKRITGSTGGTYNINQSGSTSIQMSIDANNSGVGSFNPNLSCISPSFSGFLHLVKA